MSAATKRRRRPPSAEQRAERRAAERQKMAEAIAVLTSSEGWERWLRARRRFRTYSLDNQLLIAHQCPEATHVAGFRAWLGLGYCVGKGQKAIRIWAPLPPSKKAIERWKREGARPEDAPQTRFRLVAVFDRSQVSPLPEHPGGPAPLEPPHEPISGDGLAAQIEPLCALAASLGCEVGFEPVAGSAQGYHEPASGRIVIDSDPELAANARVSILIHELAHALVRIDRRGADPTLRYGEEEVVAEAVAYCVCAGLGLDTGGAAVPYVAGWGGERAAEQVELYAALIDRLARRIEGALAD
ncbi:MAG TPA: ArdC-like ssDNA-binding domain-containing protein [Solirubrobacterales bacterium]|nr:ArdC-like ssDNA-binding domain-containing protein [Solirubrobacterales bacterium]